MKEQPVNQTRKAILLFLVFTFAFSSIFYALIIHAGKLSAGRGLFTTGLMWCPGMSAFLTAVILKRKISSFAWQWGNPKYQLWSYLLPLLYATVAYLIIWMSGWGGFYNKETVSNLTESFGFKNVPAGVTIALYFVLTALFRIVSSMSNAAGEEIGWRGFLVPEMVKLTGYTQTSLITGAIWAIWHLPILVFADYNSGTPAWYGFSCFAVMVISSSFIFTWFRLKSNSLWTGVLLHASHNLFIQAFFTPMTIDTGNTKYFYDEFGIVLPVVNLMLAIYFWTRRGELNISRQAL